jgi:hypothetical protein
VAWRHSSRRLLDERRLCIVDAEVGPLTPPTRTTARVWTCALSWHKQLRHYLLLDENNWTRKPTVAHNGVRLVKRTRAVLKSNQPRNSQLETHPDDGRAVAAGLTPPSEGKIS